MKKLMFVILMIAMSGCTTKNQHGDCVGVADEKDPKLTYKYETFNLVMAFIFSETIVVPAIVVLKELECPVGQK